MWGICLLSLGFGARRPEYSASQESFEIRSLPGAPPISWRQFAGYIDVGSRGSLYFWFVESQSAPASDPLLLWTNGGPGCSGLTGFMTEHGPFRPTPHGTLELNRYSWNSIANVLYIEQPVGVGFSRAEGKLKYDDGLAAADNIRFIKRWLVTFSQYATNRFFISSESYGGHYMPTLASALVRDGGVPSFSGLMVGNPLTYLTYRNFGMYATYYGHQLIPKPLWDEYVAADCADAAGLSPGERCAAITERMDRMTAGLDPYALAFPKCNDSQLMAGRHERHTLRATISKATAAAARASGERATGGGYPYFPTDYEPCDSDWAVAYLSRSDVQRAIHARPPAAGNWSACADIEYSEADVAAPMMPVWRQLLASNLSRSGSLKLLVFSGDDDAVCATRGSQRWIWRVADQMGLGEPAPHWEPWTMRDGPGCHLVGGEGPACTQVAGFATVWRQFSFVTVHGAGHLVPATRPAQGLAVLHNFLNGVW
tara:strand:+ start:566 stop:2017 length:1452 start_codon:yes stop_codon:yes gene_type:complete